MDRVLSIAHGHNTLEVHYAVHHRDTMHKRNLLRITKSVGLSQINLTPDRSVRGCRPCRRRGCRGYNVRVSYHRRLSPTQEIGQKPRAVSRVKVDKTIDCKRELRGWDIFIERNLPIVVGALVTVLGYPHT
jgi:hypothetical protein